MTTLRNSQNRYRWKRATVCSLVVMLASLAALFGARHFALHRTTATASARDTDEAAIQSLSNKILADDQRQSLLQDEEGKLREEMHNAPAPMTVSSPTERVQHELVESFGDLLILENQGEADSMEEVAVRAKIDGLQALYATLPLSSGKKSPQPSAKVLALQKQLAAADDQISQNEAQTKTDVQRRDQLVRAKEARAKPSVELPVLDWWSILSTSFILALIAGVAVFTSSGFVTVVGDEAFLRELLPATVDVAGTIKHMR